MLLLLRLLRLILSCCCLFCVVVLLLLVVVPVSHLFHIHISYFMTVNCYDNTNDNNDHHIDNAHRDQAGNDKTKAMAITMTVNIKLI